MPFIVKARPVMFNPTDAAVRDSNASHTTNPVWRQKIASCPIEADGFITGCAFMSPRDHVMFDIGIGSVGNEVVIADAVYVEPFDGAFGSSRSVFLPVRIPKGVRVAMRCWGNAGGGSISAGITVVKNMGYPPGQYAIFEGKQNQALPTSSGTTGAIVEISAGLKYKYKYLCPYFGSNGTGASNQNVSWVLLVGPSGQEIGFWFHHCMNDSRIDQNTATPFPIIANPFPKGARISARATTGGNTKRVGLIGIV